MPYTVNHDEQDALDVLYATVERLAKHGCGLDYIVQEVENAYRPFITERKDGAA